MESLPLCVCNYHLNATPISVFKSNFNSETLWYQSRGTFTNMNVFASVLPVTTMEARTAGGEGCSSPGDYLRCNKATFELNLRSQHNIRMLLHFTLVEIVL